MIHLRGEEVHKVQQNEEPPYVQGAILCQGRNFTEGVRCPPHKLEKYLPVLYVQSTGCQFPSWPGKKNQQRVNQGFMLPFANW